MLENTLRVRCRNLRCRSKLPIPTDNEHKAFCSPYCRNQFYFWKCAVCEEPIQKGRRRKQPDHCHRRDCRLNFRRFPETYLFAETTPDSPTCNYGSGSAHFTGLESAIEGIGPRIIAGPSLSEFSLWAATLDPPKPAQTAKPACQHQQPGDLAAEWTAREWARREADDAEYVAEDEARLRTEPVDHSGNYAPLDNGAP
jgi:hypothetical protein